jgi:hypothetical protein
MSFICVLHHRTRFFRSDRTICRGVLVGLFVVAASFNSTPSVAWSASVAPEVLRLEVTGGGGGTDQIVVEGSDWGRFGTPGGGDRVFILRRADRKLCNAATEN